ncbi:hypothetical protein [Uliginosibacterium gangwonense]|uniref:hypothetical protein n=1 Tax=Uliginosibacterium gangwonense TaxID=392736 RepID=UPI00036CA8DE|nr:hypothetical protein [Uliginosibacterium gangwonense]
MDEATCKTLATDLAFQAVDLLGARPMTIKQVLSLDDPDSITDFERLKQILLMAYDAGRAVQENSPLPVAFREALQALRDQARYAADTLADKVRQRRDQPSAAQALRDAQRRMATRRMQVGIIHYVLMYSGDENLTIDNLTDDRLAQLLGLSLDQSQSHDGAVPGSTGDSVAPSAPELEHAS